MRKLLLLALAATLAAPALARAEGWPSRKAMKRGRTSAPKIIRDAGRSRAAVPSARALAQAPTPSPRVVATRSPAPRVTYRDPRVVLRVEPLPFWLGRSWGWGYYPLWPSPDDEGEAPGYLPEDARRLSARLQAFGAGAPHAAAGTVALSLEGPVAGLDADVTGLAIGSPSDAATAAALTLASARATWAIASDDAFRVRLELGGSMLAVPATGSYAGTAYADTIAFGPQVGLSGHLGLVGPFGLEGYARLTPYPVPVIDARAAVVLRGGPLALSAGWRSIDVNGDGLDRPEAHFKGPEVGLQLVF